ncbi:MAG: Ku protein [Ferruginibacter sp.]|nr:Ku protein [Ferruginibacter sp.]
MKAIWTGSIGFGLVNIPIKMYSAIQSSSLDFDMLDKKDLSNIRFKRVNEKTNKEVLWENIVKGYMLDGKYVVLDDKDFAKAAPEKSEHIEITQFVDENEIDSIYFETPYYLQPEKSGTRAYALLKEALKKSGKVGLGSFVMRQREHFCIIRAKDDILLLNRLRFQHEIRTTEELNLPTAKSKPEEVKMAVTLIEQLTKPFNPTNFKDEYNDRLLKIIKSKAKGKSVPFKPLKVVHSTSQDLMEQLQASLSTKKKKAS